MGSAKENEYQMPVKSTSYTTGGGFNKFHRYFVFLQPFQLAKLGFSLNMTEKVMKKEILFYSD